LPLFATFTMCMTRAAARVKSLVLKITR